MSFIGRPAAVPLLGTGPDPKPAFAWDFRRTLSLPPSMTFTRASSATAWRESVLTTFATNVPRVEQDPVTKALLGLLLEGARTSVCLQNETINTGTWSSNNVSFVDNAIAAPDGATTADKIEEDANSGVSHRFNRTFTSTIATWALSQFAKAGERSVFFPTTWDTSTESGGSFNLSTGVASGAEGNAVLSIQALPSSWYRTIVTRALAAVSASSGVVNYLQAHATYQGVLGSGLYVWGSQLELEFASSYIGPAVGSSVTRAADICTATRTAPAKGTIRVRGRTAAGSGTQVLFQWDDGTEDNRLTIYRDSSNALHAMVVSGGVTQADITLATVAANTEFTVAMAFDTNDVRAAANGTLGTADASATIPTGLTTQRWGSDSAGANGWFGHLQAYADFADPVNDNLLKRWSA